MSWKSIANNFIKFTIKISYVVKYDKYSTYVEFPFTVEICKIYINIATTMISD